MDLNHRLALAVLFACAGPVSAFGQSQTQPVVVTSTNTGGANQTQPVGNGAGNSTPMPVTPVIGTSNSLVAVAGTQVGLTISSATAPTVPVGATVLLIQAQGSNNGTNECLFWRDDGTNPTGTTGQGIGALGSLYYQVKAVPIMLIQATGASCTATISYYHY